MNQNIMNHEVTKAICRDSKSYKKTSKKPASAPTEKKNTRNSKKIAKKYHYARRYSHISADDGLHENTT
jgi:hypothetical protein